MAKSRAAELSKLFKEAQARKDDAEMDRLLDIAEREGIGATRMGDDDLLTPGVAEWYRKHEGGGK